MLDELLEVPSVAHRATIVYYIKNCRTVKFPLCLCHRVIKMSSYVELRYYFFLKVMHKIFYDFRTIALPTLEFV